jgi:hypothetical protein
MDFVGSTSDGNEDPMVGRIAVISEFDNRVVSNRSVREVHIWSSDLKNLKIHVIESVEVDWVGDQDSSQVDSSVTNKTIVEGFLSGAFASFEMLVIESDITSGSRLTS